MIGCSMMYVLMAINEGKLVLTLKDIIDLLGEA